MPALSITWSSYFRWTWSSWWRQVSVKLGAYWACPLTELFALSPRFCCRLQRNRLKSAVSKKRFYGDFITITVKTQNRVNTRSIVSAITTHEAPICEHNETRIKTGISGHDPVTHSRTDRPEYSMPPAHGAMNLSWIENAYSRPLLWFGDFDEWSRSARLGFWFVIRVHFH